MSNREPVPAGMTGRLLVTGGAGFIGAAVVEAALVEGWRVRVLDSLRPDVHAGERLPHPEAEFVEADVRDQDAVRRALVGVDAVCHQAAKVGLGVGIGDAPDYVSTNSLGTAVLLAEMADGAPRVFEDGRQRRDFVHVRDVAAANIAALRWTRDGAEATARAFNVATGVPHTIGEFADTLAEAFGGPPPVLTGEFRMGDVRHITASAGRIADELGWHPSVGFDAGVREFSRAPLRARVGGA